MSTADPMRSLLRATLRPAMASAVAGTPHLPASAASSFRPETIVDAAMQRRRVSPLAASRITALFRGSGCRMSGMTLHAKPGLRRRLRTSGCQDRVAPARPDPPAQREIEFPMMTVTEGDSVQRLANMDQFAFTHETGHLLAVTDLDRDGRLEPWIAGPIHECGRDEDPRGSKGGRVIEEFDDAVRDLDASRWLARPKTH